MIVGSLSVTVLMCNWFVMSLTVSISVVGFVSDGSDV